MWFWKPKSKEKWTHVREFSISVRYQYIDGLIYFHLYESPTGNRKVDITTTHTLLTEKEAKDLGLKSRLYNERIVRWLGGRHDVEIPRYSECSVDDLANALKGVPK